VVIVAFFHYALQMCENHESFAKYPPRLPNLLSILTGEEKKPKGVRNRINFWGDITGLGWGLLVMQVMVISQYASGGGADRVERFGVTITIGDVQLLILLAYFLFAIFFAGIPRRRYWGMIFLGVSVFAINAIAHFVVFDALLNETSRQTMWLVYGLSAWYMLCYALLGVSGLWVFRKK
jgi:NADH:ubiquinone oxidoreductase subunit K